MGKITLGCGLLSCVLVVVSGYLLHPMLEYGNADWTSLTCVIRVTLVMPILVLAMVLADIGVHTPSDSHTVKSLFAQYFTSRMLFFFGSISKRKFLQGNKNIQKMQEAYLAMILRDCVDTEYGRHNKLELITTREDLTRVHPLTEFQHYEDYIERVCDGEEGVMVNRPLEFIALSSGTTGKFKHMPIFTGDMEEFRSSLGFVINYVHNKTNALKRELIVRFKPKEMTSKAGVPMGAISYWHSPPPVYSLVPQGADKITNQETQSYIIALFALAERDIQYIDFLLAPMCTTFFRRIEESGEDLCQDLENGCLSEVIEVEPSIREIVNTHLNADPYRAREVYRELSEGNDSLALRLWPNLKITTMCTTGAFESHARSNGASFLKGVFCKGFGFISSEASIGVSWDGEKDSLKGTQTYAFAHSGAFFEFIPEEEIEIESPKTLFLDQLQQGCSYEIVITTRNGFFRYRLGDVIKVVGFLHQNPIYEFLYRAGQLLNIKTEKTSENVFYSALKAAEAEWKGITIDDYTTTESTNVEHLPGLTHNCPCYLTAYKWNKEEKKYLLFIEIRKKFQSDEITFTHILRKDQQQLVDSKLREQSEVYDAYRKNGSIQNMKVIQVRSGTFFKLKDLAIKHTNNQQYKTPRALRKPEQLTLLLDNRMEEMRPSTRDARIVKLPDNRILDIRHLLSADTGSDTG